MCSCTCISNASEAPANILLALFRREGLLCSDRLGLPTHQLSALHIPKATGNIHLFLCVVFREKKNVPFHLD